jgi:hypothetical protein
MRRCRCFFERLPVIHASLDSALNSQVKIYRNARDRRACGAEIDPYNARSLLPVETPGRMSEWWGDAGPESGLAVG